MFSTVNLNGNLISKDSVAFSFNHLGWQNGEIIIEPIRLYAGSFLFAEQHYFHLMAQMRMARMEIPMEFTPEFFYIECGKLKEFSGLKNAKFNFFVSLNNEMVDFWIIAESLGNDLIFSEFYEIDQYRETHVANCFHNRIGFANPRNRILKTFAKENDLNDLILLNENKTIARAIDGNIFVIHENQLLTPTLENGALDDVLRDQILKTAQKMPHFDGVKEEAIFPFSLMKADEVFVAKNGVGIFAVSKFRKKEFLTDYSEEIALHLV